MKIIQKLLTVNHRKGRIYNNTKYKSIGICNHISVGLRGSVTNWFNNPNSQSSYHYLVCKNGDIIQFVRDEDTAWSQGIVNKPTAKIYFDNGRINPNWYLISISHEVTSTEALTEEQYQSSLWLHNELINKYNIPITREFIIGHFELDSVNRVNDPQRNFPWDRLINDLIKLNNKEDVSMKKIENIDEALKVLVDNGVLNSPDYWKAASNMVKYFDIFILNVANKLNGWKGGK